MKKYLFLLIILALPVLARAVVPEYGVYYNPFRQGLGYYVEIQDTTLVMIVYAYDQETEEPVFYYTSGKITRGEHLISTTLDPRVELLYDYPYKFSGPLYRFKNGPCLTCLVDGWNTAEHAEQVGEVVMRSWDFGRFSLMFNMHDGSEVASENLRQIFGRSGFPVRDEGYLGPPIWISFPSYQGSWVFSDMAHANEPLWVVNFSRVKGPYKPESNPFGPLDYYNSRGMPVVDFIDDASGSLLRCYQYGCRMTSEGRDNIYMKFFDAGMDRALGYLGDYIDTDMGLGDGGFIHQDEKDIYYRTDHLVRGVHIVDPIPDAAPPPQE